LVKGLLDERNVGKARTEIERLLDYIEYMELCGV